jgi:type VI secretion system protein ImpI
VEADRGLGGLVGSRKAKLWDAYVERWRAKTKRSDGRLSEAFMLLFAESYDRLQRKEP